jgi:hypothetical protein
MAHFILYRPQTNWYVRFVRIADLQIWDNTNSRMDADPAWADSVVSLTFNEYVGGYPVTLPAGLPTGEYHMLFYDAAVPAATDQVQAGKIIQVRSGVVSYPAQKALDI